MTHLSSRRTVLENSLLPPMDGTQATGEPRKCAPLKPLNYLKNDSANLRILPSRKSNPPLNCIKPWIPHNFSSTIDSFSPVSVEYWLQWTGVFFFSFFFSPNHHLLDPSRPGRKRRTKCGYHAKPSFAKKQGGWTKQNYLEGQKWLRCKSWVVGRRPWNLPERWIYLSCASDLQAWSLILLLGPISVSL